MRTEIDDVMEGCHVQTHVWVHEKRHERDVERGGEKGWNLFVNRRVRDEKANDGSQPRADGQSKCETTPSDGERLCPSYRKERKK